MKRTTVTLTRRYTSGNQTGSPAELKALGVFLAAIADNPADIQTRIGSFDVDLSVRVEIEVFCSECHSRRWRNQNAIDGVQMMCEFGHGPMTVTA